MDNDSVKEQIKRLVRIEDVVSDYVQLQRAGKRLKALCPFHQEKTPSFYVHPEMGLYKCFGCGVGGDVFDFLMRIEHISFPEAGRRLAERVGLQWRSGPVDEAKTKRREMARRANQIAGQYFQSLLRSPQGGHALQYLYDRDFSDETIEKFGLGYAADSWDALLRHLRSKGIDGDIAAEAGLAKERDSGGHYDAFRNRVMFPIVQASGQVIAFGGRALDPEDPAKYLNSPDTPLFKKREQLYGLNLANTAINQTDTVIVVEGYTDVLALHQAGIENVVACLGTALTENHLHLLSRYADEVILAYDADAAGMNAAVRNIAMLENCAADVQIVILPEGLDPDDCVKQRGADGFMQVLDSRKSPVAYQVDLIFSQYSERGGSQLLRAASKVVDALLRVPDRTRRNEYIAQAADRWGEGSPQRTEAMQAALSQELRRRQRTSTRRGRKPNKRQESDADFIVEGVSRLAEKVPAGIRGAENEVLAAALHDERYAQMLAESLDPEEFCDEPRQQLARAITDELEAAQLYDPERIIEGVCANEQAYELAVELAVSEAEEIDEALVRRSFEKLKQYYLCGGHQPKYEVNAASDDEELPDLPPLEDWHEFEKRVAAKLGAEDCDHDDPEVAYYMEVMRRTHGSGRDKDT